MSSLISAVWIPAIKIRIFQGGAMTLFISQSQKWAWIQKMQNVLIVLAEWIKFYLKPPKSQSIAVVTWLFSYFREKLILQLLHRGVDNIERRFCHLESEVGGSVIIRTKDLKTIRLELRRTEEVVSVSDSLEKLCAIGM